MATMNISLPETMKTFVEQELDRGGYMTASEYFRDLVRAEQRRRAQEKLEGLLLEGIQSGPEIPVTPQVWGNLEEEIADSNPAP